MNNKEIFEKINEILLKDLKPSKNLKNLIIDGYLDKEPFNKIKKLNDIEGKDIAMKFLNELTDDKHFKQKVSELVRWHMQPLFYDKNLQFFQPQNMINDVEYKEVALLSLCDRLGRGNLDEDRIKYEKERIEKFKLYFEK